MDAFENPIVNLYIMAWLQIYDTCLGLANVFHFALAWRSFIGWKKTKSILISSHNFDKKEYETPFNNSVGGQENRAERRNKEKILNL